MRVLSVVGRGYYGSTNAVEPMYLYFTEPLRQLGHDVDVFDHVRVSRESGSDEATVALDRRLAQGWDVVLYQHAPTAEEPIDVSVFVPWKDRTCVIAWNSDDDWQWSRTKLAAQCFTWMATTYPQVWARERVGVPNLLLSQWGCLGTYANPATTRDIDFSFAGWVYRSRVTECRVLRRQAGLRCFGKGSRLVRLPVPNIRGLGRMPRLAGPALGFAEINDVWNRTKVSFTPLSGGPSGSVKSIKSRLFDMGLSGSVALTEHAPHLEDYFDLDDEVVVYTGLEDCVDKVAALLSDDARRRQIAEAYRRRTLADHLWTTRFTRLFSDAGLGTGSASGPA
jgi:spore maturation protein CgeB